jgi:hypothetical protein
MFCVAMAVGFLALWGWWGALLWERFRNPFFPFFGSIFPSPWAPVIFIHDVRFFPRDFLQWMFYPFFWLQGHPFIASEEPLRDPRFALVYMALAVALLAAFTRRLPFLPRQVAALWVFFALSYFFWLIGFSILRYAISLEAISGIVICTVLRPIFHNRSPWVLAIICFAAIGFTKPIGWGRIGYDKALLEAPMPEVAPHSMVFLSGAPIGFVVPYLDSQGSSFISLDWLARGTAEFSAVRKRLQHASTIRLLTNVPISNADSTAINARLAPLGLVYSELSCLPVRSPLQQTVRLCAVKSQLP